MFTNRRYILDKESLEFRREGLPLKIKLLRSVVGFLLSIALTIVYATVFKAFFGSPKEKLLSQQLDEIKLNYSIVAKRINNSVAVLENFQLSDDMRYRPVLDMDSVPGAYRKVGIGGIDHYKDLTGYVNSDMLISYRSRLYTVANMAKVQKESFKAVADRANEWKIEMDHQPMISPVDVKYMLGDRFEFREVHPVLGTPRMHYGQDFRVPMGTEVYATGNGTIYEAGWDSGFGNYVTIDHGHGLRTIYGHLSQIRAVKGKHVKRGDMIGLSGNTGTSSGPHLHYQIDQFGQPKNPINFFNNDITAEEYNEMIQVWASKSKFR